MKRLTRTLPLVFLFLLGSCTGFLPWGEPDDFIRVRGTHFLHNGRLYFFGGTNLWYGCYLGSPGATGDRERLGRELDSLSDLGLTNLRLLAGSEESSLRRTLKPAITGTPGNLNDSLLQGLDYVLAEMADRQMHAVLFLNNYWEWSGGMAQYNVWVGGPVVDPDVHPEGWNGFMNYSARFYANEKGNALFRDFIRAIVMRRNSYNGRLYREDPTIMAWQLANEPRPGANTPEASENLEGYYRWIEATASYIHSLDTNHLVSTGSEGAVGFRWSNEYAVRTHASPAIDYVTFHLWPGNWEWYDPQRSAETLPVARAKGMKYVADQIAVARQLRKPITLEEFGLARDSARCTPGTPVTARDTYFGELLAARLDSARAGAPIAGWNCWGWGGEAQALHPDFLWRPGDPFLADPPHEPQGYNSVFISDTSTLRILRDHAFKMMRLGAPDPLHAEFQRP